MDQRLSHLRIWSTKGVGSKKAQDILELVEGNANHVFELGREYFEEHSQLSKNIIENLFSTESLDCAENIFTHVCKYGIQLCVKGEEGYPAGLEALDDSPYVLFTEGNGVFPTRTIAVVGSRKPSSESLALTDKFSTYLVQNEIGIISGFARGIDHAAHRVAVESRNGWTAAILGSGLRNIYPGDFSGFANQLKKSGVLISEFGLFEEARPQYFPQRNRLIAALADALLVVEASDKSGSLITAENALRLGKEIFVIPLNPKVSTEGSNRLIKDGAICVTNPEEIFQHLRWEGEDKASDIEACSHPILKALEENTLLSIDEIIGITKLNISEIMTQLGRFELNGMVSPYPGQKWAIKKKMTRI